MLGPAPSTFAAALLLACAAASPAPAAPAVAPVALARATGELPAPAVAPVALARATGELPAPDDPLELLYAHRLNFTPDGSPLVTVRIDEGEEQIVLVPRGPVQLHGGGRSAGGPGGTPLLLRVREGQPAQQRFAAVAVEVPFRDKAGARAAQEEWTRRGFPVRIVVDGGVYGIAGRVLDTRHYALLLGEPTDRATAQRQLAAAERFSARVTLRQELITRPTGLVEVVGEDGVVIASGRGVVVIEVPGGEGITVRAVEHDAGYSAHGREDRTYRGRVFATVGADGKIAAVDVLPIEEHLRGIVPSEIYASSPAEALKAQAVTARGEVLAKIGARHLSDPYLLCAEQHCQVHKGIAGEHPATDASILRTRGEALFAKRGGLVDSVYSSTCGGHTEDNEAVWGGVPDPSLRGVPDWAGHPEALLPFEQRIEEAEVPAFLSADVPAMCRKATLARAEKYRWERRFTSAELDALVASLGVGHVQALSVTGRGSSGRALGLSITGDRGATVVKGELTIRRLLKNLNSALFVVEPEGPPGARTGWLFRGAGWGHGVGMCQTGAIGRAEAGQDHRAILGHYFSGAEVAKLY